MRRRMTKLIVKHLKVHPLVARNYQWKRVSINARLWRLFASLPPSLPLSLLLSIPHSIPPSLPPSLHPSLPPSLPPSLSLSLVQILIFASLIQRTADCEKALDRGEKKGLKSIKKKQVHHAYTSSTVNTLNTQTSSAYAQCMCNEWNWLLSSATVATGCMLN